MNKPYRKGNGRSCAKSGYECGPCKNGFEELPQANNQVSKRCVPNQRAKLITTIGKVIPSSTKRSPTKLSTWTSSVASTTGK